MSDSKYTALPTEDPADLESQADDSPKRSKSGKSAKKSGKEGDEPKKASSKKKVSASDGAKDAPEKKQSKKSVSKAADDEDEENVKIQFAAPQFYCTEDSNCIVRVMRLGAVNESCSVKYQTQDGSAKAGVKYSETSGVLKFEPGELQKSFEVEIISSTSFDTVLEFKVVLEPQRGCTVCPHMKSCRVMVLDNDTFPDSKYKEVIDSRDEDALQSAGIGLLFAYMKLALLNVPGVWWKALLTIAFDQLENIYDLGMVYLRVYLVDVVLNKDSDASHLIVKGDRKQTAMLLAGVFIGPCFILFIVERLKQGPWYMGAALNESLKVNIFRKYLNFTNSSRRVAPVQELSGAMTGDVPDLVENGVMGMFEVIQYCGKILSTGYFVVSKSPMNAVPLALYPLILITFTWCRQSTATDLQDAVNEADGDVLGTVLGAHRDFEIIVDYGQRGLAVDLFEEQLLKFRRADHKDRIFNFYSEQLVPMITNMIVAFYICYGSQQVLAGHVTVGAFVATVGIFQTLGTKFEKIYTRARTWLTAVGPIVGLTQLLSLPTVTQDRMEKCKQIGKTQKELVTKFQGEMKKEKDAAVIYNNLPFRITGVTVPKIPALKDLKIETAQGQITAIIGPHMSGKESLLRLITKGSSGSGLVFLPEHLRCLNVAYQPVILTDFSLLDNVCFGTALMEKGLSESDKSRVENICKMVGLSQQCLTTLHQDIKAKDEEVKKKKAGEEEEEEEAEEEESHDETWWSQLSFSMKRRIHFCRAFNYDPELLVMHKPLNDMDQVEVPSFLRLLRRFVEDRGLSSDGDVQARVPRSIFASAGEIEAASDLAASADVVWRLSLKAKLSESPGGTKQEVKPSKPSVPESNTVNLLDSPSPEKEEGNEEEEAAE